MPAFPGHLMSRQSSPLHRLTWRDDNRCSRFAGLLHSVHPGFSARPEQWRFTGVGKRSYTKYRRNVMCFSSLPHIPQIQRSALNARACSPPLASRGLSLPGQSCTAPLVLTGNDLAVIVRSSINSLSAAFRTLCARTAPILGLRALINSNFN